MILLICPSGFPGVMRYFNGISCNIENTKTIDVKSINKEYDFSNVSTIILGSWSDEYLKILDYIKNKNIKVYIGWCSPLLQIELSKEKEKFFHILSLCKRNLIKGLVVLDIRLYDLLKNTINMVFIPALLEEKEFIHSDSEKTDLFLFGPNHPRKNLLNQVYLVSEVLKSNQDLFCSTNLSYKDYYNFLDKDVVQRISIYDWLERSDYVQKVIEKCRFGLCITCSESFNYNLWEYLMAGSPVITSIDQKRYVSSLLDFIEVENKKQNLLSEHILWTDMNDPKTASLKVISKIKQSDKDLDKMIVQVVKEINSRAILIAREKITNLS